MRSIVSMGANGRVTLPADARRALGLKEEAFFEVHLEKGAIVLRPVAIVPLDATQQQPPASA